MMVYGSTWNGAQGCYQVADTNYHGYVRKWSANPKWYDEIVHVSDLMHVDEDSTIVDIGCSHGRAGLIYNNRYNVKCYTGIDVGRSSHQYAFHCNYLEYDGITIPIGSNTATHILFSHSLCHIPNYLWILYECRRILKVGGYIGFVNPNPNFVKSHYILNKLGIIQHSPDTTKLHNFTRSDMSYICDSTRYGLVHNEYYGDTPSFIPFRVDALRERLITVYRRYRSLQ